MKYAGVFVVVVFEYLFLRAMVGADGRRDGGSFKMRF